MTAGAAAAEELRAAPPPAERVRLAFRGHAAGVAVVTAAGRRAPAGFTATSVVSLSLDPPLVSLNVSRTASSWPAVESARHLGVHLLSSADAVLARRFSRSGIDRFAAPTAWAPGPFGVPVLDTRGPVLLGAVLELLRVGDHGLVVVEVREVLGDPHHGAPLLYHDGGFASVRPLPEATT